MKPIEVQEIFWWHYSYVKQNINCSHSGNVEFISNFTQLSKNYALVITWLENGAKVQERNNLGFQLEFYDNCDSFVLYLFHFQDLEQTIALNKSIVTFCTYID